MAQWSRADRTVYAKLVYYGPAYGGKTTNLESLHRLTDPERLNDLVSVRTSDDRTLFFDVLPVDLGELLGYRVALKVYTVPGQVRYDETRRIVLAGADAVVFVADSTRIREADNRESLQNLAANLRANRLDVTDIPIVHQYNKQDLDDAASPEVVARWLDLDPARGFPAVAVTGEGVLETFVEASRRMMERLVRVADPSGRHGLDAESIGRRIEESLGPSQGRLLASGTADAPRRPSSESPLVLEGEDTGRMAIEATVRLGERLSVETSRARRLDREGEALRRVSDLLARVGASFDQETIVHETLEAAATVLEAPRVSLVGEPSPGVVTLEASATAAEDPLMRTPEGRQMLRGWVGQGDTQTVPDVGSTVYDPATLGSLAGYRSVAAVPVAAGDEGSRRILVAYSAAPDATFGAGDLRFLEQLALHLSVGLEKSRLHAELERHRDRLETVVGSRTKQLRRAYDELRSIERMKDRFLANLSHEMKTPLTAMVGAASFLRDYDAKPEERKEMVGSIVDAGRTLERQLDDLFRLVETQGASSPLELETADGDALAHEAMALCESARVSVEIENPGSWRADPGRLARAVANLLDNAAKFAGEPIELKIEPAQLVCDGVPVAAAAISVLDRGPGVPEEDRERIFLAFEQGGDPMTGKPHGVGIGLHEARTIVELHGGRLEYRPRPGGGSVFSIRVPLRPAGELQLPRAGEA